MALAPQAQAALLLTVPLGKPDLGAKPLTPGEWGRFASWLNDRQLSPAALLDCTPERGGTWNGAVENLKREWVPLWVQPTDSPASGNAALVDRGARWLPTPLGPDTLDALTGPGRASPAVNEPTAGIDVATVAQGSLPLDGVGALAGAKENS